MSLLPKKPNETPTVPRRRLHPVFQMMLGIGMLFTATFLCVAIGIWLFGAATTYAAMDAFRRNAYPWALVLQLLVGFLLWWRWAWFADFLERHGRLNTQGKRKMLAERDQALLMLLAINLIFQLPQLADWLQS